jgi:uncharacterized phage protein (TIGR01671 family)
MRQIKFRVWDKLAERFTRCDEGYQGHYVLSLNGEYHNLQNGSGGKECVVQQYTGLVDKNSVEIYEGDILKCKGFDGWFDKVGFYYNVPVKYNTVESGESHIAGYAYIPMDREVIGNIFENHELLKA